MNLDDRYIKVKGHSDLVKDKSGNAILNADTSAFKIFKAKSKEKEELNSRLSNIEESLTILSMQLTKLIGKDNGN